MKLRSLNAQEARDMLGTNVIRNLNDQLLLVLLNRAGGTVEVPCAELDATGEFIARLEVDHDNRIFTLKLERKQ